MKNGRFSEKKRGYRWFTWTWNASLSTWLKSGLTVPSSVAWEVRPYFTVRPASGSESAGANAAGVARVSRREYVAEGVTSRVSGRLRSWRISAACCSMKLFPAGTIGHEADMPRRLTRRQNRTPMRTSGPLLNRMVVRGTRISTS
jgi:hypothetical protein